MEKFEFFWKGPLSQWKKSTFVDKNAIEYNCAEQYMMYQKAILFHDFETAKLIFNTKHPREQKDLGRKIKNFNQIIWDQHKFDIVYQGNFFKFTQDHLLLDNLFKTKGKTLVEASPYDSIWGVGLAEDNPKIMNKENWRGENLLGYILTKLREDLIKSSIKIKERINEKTTNFCEQ